MEFNYKIKIMSIHNNSNNKYQFRMEGIITEMKIYYVRYWHYLKNQMKVGQNWLKEILIENSNQKNNKND